MFPFIKGNRAMISNLDFSKFHALDHWPFTPYCYEQPYGGGWYHMLLAWQYRRRDQLVGVFYRLLACPFGRHDMRTWWPADDRPAYAKCEFCRLQRPPTEEELNDRPPFIGS